jgi:hypothetical protein
MRERMTRSGYNCAAMSRKKKDGVREAGPPGWVPFALFLLAFVLRLLFWQATPDRSWAYSAYYQGDALVWLEYAGALQNELPFAQDLPLRPPGNGYLVAMLWDGTPGGLSWLKLAWCLLGALAVPFLYKGARDAFGYPVALAVGLVAAAASPLLIFATSINNETPYLFLVSLLLATFRRTALSGSLPRLAGWGLINALACLFRAEHLLFFLLATVALFASSWRHDRIGTTPRLIGKRLTVIAAAAVLTLLPWHLEAWSEARRFNRQEPTLPPDTEQAMAGFERQLAYLAWDAEAKAQEAALPAFIRRTMSNFVAATVAWRGGREVRGADFAILEEAFGSRPEPISEFPLIALYGGLNFHLANPGDGNGGFSRAALQEKPPLAGGAERYPPMLVGGLPPDDLAFTYPPHLAAVNHGYSLGLGWLAENPGAAAALFARKAAIFWSGAAPGLTGFNLPLGLSGERRKVDLVVPTGGPAIGWRLIVLGLCLYGLYLNRRRLDAAPFFVLLLTQLVASLAFFGYARLGALAIPAIAAFAACAVAALPWPFAALKEKRLTRFALIAGLFLLGAEMLRTVKSPLPHLDGVSTAQGDPFDPGVHEVRRLELR